MSMLKGKDILRTDLLTDEEVELVLSTAARFEGVLLSGGSLQNMANLVLATLFFEPSTRTRLSFETAMHRLGGQIVTVADPKTSSAAKGESLADSMRTVEGYADVIVIRHPRKGSAEEAAEAVSIPVINAGDGTGQHPTQALLDVYTIQKEKGSLDGLTVTLAGDLKNGRTVHSLSNLLARLGTRLHLVSPAGLEMPAEITAALRSEGADVTVGTDLAAAMRESDVVYVTRIQRERFEDPQEYESQGRLCAGLIHDRAGQAGDHHHAPPAQSGRDCHRGRPVPGCRLLPTGCQWRARSDGVAGPGQRTRVALSS